ncbi:MAG TPA: tetratricopeptide repeat protein [Caulobacteraceae bacterium]|nr:tetratricopeptide repeat protein [Caulobacteraceae bacterium]
MVDFIEEVEEQLRSDRYRALAWRIAPWFIAAFVAVVVGWLGAWGWTTLQARNVAKASQAYDKALQALAQNDETGAFTDLDAVAKSGPPAYKALALMQQGNIRLSANKADEAAAFYDKAAKAAPNPVIGDVARMKAVWALMDTAPYPQIETRLKPLMGEKKPMDLYAKEALAMAKLAAGRTAEARSELQALTLTLGAPQGMRARAQAALGVIDSGQAKVATQVVKAAATLPPPAQPNFAPSPGAAPGPEGQAPAGAAQPAPGSDQ